MKKFDLTILTVAVLILALVFVVPKTSTGAATNDENVATINGTTITKDQFHQEMKDRYGKKVLDTLVTDTLVEQEAAKNHIEVSKDELDKTFESYKKRVEQQEGQTFDQYLKSIGATEDELKERLRKKLLMRDTIEKLVTVSDEEAKAFFDKHPKNFGKDVKSFDEVKDKVKSKVMTNKVNDWIDSLKKNAKIDISDPKLSITTKQ